MKATYFSDFNGWQTSPSYWQTLKLVDVNNDGKADVCGRGPGGIFCSLSLGNIFGTATLWSSQYSDSNNWNSDPAYWSTIQFADLNGDGLPDVCGRGGAGMVCAVNSGFAFVGVGVWTTQFSDAYGWKQPQYYSTIRLADIDGDGRADVCGRGAAGFYCGLSMGGAFGDASMLVLPEFSDANGWAQEDHYRSLWLVDADNDGKADICGRGTLGIWCGFSSSYGTVVRFAPARLWVSNFGDNYYWNISESYWGTVQPIHSASPVPPRGTAFCGRGNAGIWCSNLYSVATL